MIDRENIGFAMRYARVRLSKTLFRYERKELSFDLRIGRYNWHTIKQRLVGIGCNAVADEIHDRSASHAVRRVLVRTMQHERVMKTGLARLLKSRDRIELSPLFVCKVLIYGRHIG